MDVHLIKYDDKITLQIIDDGVGFDPATVKKGIGLENMNRRAKLFSGRVNINTAPGKGCHVLVELPLQQTRS
ncbi:MAG: hypothetical protein IPH18_17785 [Chitinophagaceae bacterium]|nr:hypothetical protein [Chitinophagaceae bacterium]